MIVWGMPSSSFPYVAKPCLSLHVAFSITDHILLEIDIRIFNEPQLHRHLRRSLSSDQSLVSMNRHVRPRFSCFTDSIKEIVGNSRFNLTVAPESLLTLTTSFVHVLLQLFFFRGHACSVTLIPSMSLGDFEGTTVPR